MTPSEQSDTWNAWAVDGHLIRLRADVEMGRVEVSVGTCALSLNAGHVEQLVFALHQAVSAAWPGEGNGESVVIHALEHGGLRS